MASAVVMPGPVHAQSPLDIFATHSGASRSPSRVKQEWFAASFLLLTEFDGRFDDPEATFKNVIPDLRRQDGLQTSAGYNYFTYGRNREVSANAENWFPFLPANSSLTLAWSGHLGYMHDGLLTWGQNGLHDFRQVTRNYHPNVTNGRVMIGADVEVLLWPESSWFAFGGHLSAGSFHQEQGLTAIASDRTGQVRSLLAVTAGWITNAGAGPQQITSTYGSSYFSLRTRIDAGSKFGLGAAYNSGIFPGEREFLLSLHLAVELGTSSSLRIEHVNDLLAGKDRGFTGGVRLAYVIRY